jgi:RNA polymerase sigma-70 factor (ECF subfamily)
MSEQLEFMELAQRAQRGDRGALDRLAELASKRLRVYVYRLTLQEDLTSEIVQETLLEMCRVICKLRRTDRFLPWLYGIATNKLRHFYRSEQTMKRATTAKSDMEQGVQTNQEGLENLVSQELKEIVSQAIGGLKTNHRAVLIMRCYDGMSYAEIAESMGSSEFGTRMLFLRAKKALQKQLSRQGLGRGTLMAALVLFGKMTSPSKVAAAQISISSATVNAGITASIATAASNKAALLSLAAAGAVTVGGLVHQANDPDALYVDPVPRNIHWSLLDEDTDKGMEKHWHFLPGSKEGPVFIRAQFDPGPTDPAWVVLQNAHANYLYDGAKLTMNNAHWYSRDMRVMRLPYDDAELRSFLDRVEGIKTDYPSVRVERTGGVRIDTVRDQDGYGKPKVMYSKHVLEEDIFVSDLVTDSKVADQRDSLHRQGYAYFRVHGYVADKRVQGSGCIPFVFQAWKEHQPWLYLSLGDVRVVDSKQGAMIEDRDAGFLRRYPPQSFFSGLARPWSGLHVLDTLRRDAAAEALWFTTEAGDTEDQARVTVEADDFSVIYSVDLDDDLLDRITLKNTGGIVGELVFEYTARPPDESLPRLSPSGRTDKNQGRPGMNWLVDLVQEQLRP